jgi:hypothetical protein
MLVLRRGRGGVLCGFRKGPHLPLGLAIQVSFSFAMPLFGSSINRGSGCVRCAQVPSFLVSFAGPGIFVDKVKVSDLLITGDPPCMDSLKDVVMEGAVKGGDEGVWYPLCGHAKKKLSGDKAGVKADSFFEDTCGVIKCSCNRWREYVGCEGG